MQQGSGPVVSQWYRHLDKGTPFQVTAIDEHSDTIEIQYFDGDLDEIDATEWRAMPIEPIAAPKDWSGPLDDIEPDDLGYTDTQMRDDRWPALGPEGGTDVLPAAEGGPERDESEPPD
jgi:hypothetical protein